MSWEAADDVCVFGLAEYPELLNISLLVLPSVVRVLCFSVVS